MFNQWGKISVQTFSDHFLKQLTEGNVATEIGSLFQYFTTLTEKAAPLLSLEYLVGVVVVVVEAWRPELTRMAP